MRGRVRALNARIVGDGDQVLVLSHGFGTDQSAWRHCLPIWSRDRRVILYDLACAPTVNPEFFDSRRYDSLEGYAEDLVELLDDLALGRCTFIGHSVSGMIGLLAAQRAPSTFAKLIMIAASPCYLNEGSYQGGIDRDAVADMLDAIRSKYREWAAAFAPAMIDRAPDDPETQTFLGTLLTMRPDIAFLTAKTIFFSDFRDRLSQCPAPSVIVQPRHDPAVPMTVAQYLHEHLSESVLEVVDATGHLPHLTSPQSLMRSLAPHLPPA